MTSWISSVRSRGGWGALVVVLLLGAAEPSFGQSIRCGRRLVSVGDTAYELYARCGAPAHRARLTDFRTVTVFDEFGQAIRQGIEEDIDVLTYAGDRGDLIRTITVRRGVIDAIRTGERVRMAIGKNCPIAAFRNRATYGEIRLACGAPVDRSSWVEDVAIQQFGQVFRRRVHFERWVYDPGPGSLLRIVEFRDGRLVRVTTGSRSPSK